MHWSKALVSLLCTTTAAASENERLSYPYREQLDVTPLPRNHLYTSFRFDLESEQQITSTASNTSFTHYRAFPRSLAPVLESTGTRELHLRFGQGHWDSDSWGQMPDAGHFSGGVGVEVWAAVEAKNAHEGFQQWRSLVNSLSGLFCASLNVVDEKNTVFPLRSFTQRQDAIPLFNKDNELFLLRAALPSEPVCTENLTPFVKFLPTRGKAGLASLLDGHRIFESEWHMMSIDIDTVCQGDACKYSMAQRVASVVDIARVHRRNKNQIPRPASGDELKCDQTKPYDAFQCFPLNQEQDISISLEELFGRSIKGGNLLSKHPSRVCAHVTPNWDVYLNQNDELFGTADNCFDLPDDSMIYDVILTTTNASMVKPTDNAPVLVSRSMTGLGQDKGGIRTVFTNNLDTESQLIYLETLPWFMRVYLHTLTVTGASREDVIQSIYYQPEIDRQRPTHLEFEIVLPPKSIITITYQFDKSLLLIAEYPPDANHGFSVEPGMVRVFSPTDYTTRTSPALLTLPTPDFSMPYNVIIFTATVMSLSFGTIFNLLFKRTLPELDADLVNAEFNTKARIKGKINAVKVSIGVILYTLKARLLGSENHDDANDDATPE